MEWIVFAVFGVGIVGALVWQAQVRRKVSAGQVVEAPVARRRLIVTAVMAGFALMSGLFAAMGASLENWTFAGGAGAICAVFVGSLWLTRKPIAVVRFDGVQNVLSEGETRIVLSQPFRMTSAIKLPMLRRGHPWMLVTVEQNVQSISFCFPWELASSGNAQPTSDAVPKLILDWRGAVIFERLRKSQPS